MSQAIEDRPTIAERYIGATNSRDLTVNPEARTDADVLLAAGYASAGNAAASLALRFYRLKATGDMGPFSELAGIAGRWLHRRSYYKGRKHMSALQARDLATRTMFWWLNPVCKPCDGRGHPLIPNSPVINHGHNCPVCHGTAQYPIHRIVPPGTADEARWLVDEMNRQCAFVFADMARLLAPKLDF